MWEFCRFEIRYRLRYISTYVFAIILIAIVIFMVGATGGSFSDDILISGSSIDKVFLNSPYEIFTFTIVIFLLSIFFMASFIAQMFSKDLERKFDCILFTKPITKFQYLMGRFLGNTILMCIILALCMLTYDLSIRFMPGIDPELVTTPQFLWYLSPFLVIVLPNYICLGALCIAAITAFKKTSTVFGVAFFLFMLNILADLIQDEIANPILKVLTDPLGQVIVKVITRGWTVPELNAQAIPMTYYMITNRIFWLAVSLLLFFIAYKKFNFSRGQARPSSKIDQTEQSYPPSQTDTSWPSPTFSFTTTLHQFTTLFRFNLRQVFQSPSLYWVTFLGAIFLFFSVTVSGRIMGTNTLPVTYIVANTIFNGFELLMLLIITFFTGELVFRAKESKFDVIEDTYPTNALTQYLSKFATMIVLLVYYSLLMIIAGIIYQTIRGYYHYEIGLYLKMLFMQEFPNYIMLLILTFFIHTLTKHKYIAHFVFILFMIGIGALIGQLGVTHNLLIPFGSPNISYSDMTGFGNNILAAFWFNLYWFLIMLILAGVTVGWPKSPFLWKGGTSSVCPQRGHGLLYPSTLLLLILLVASYIFYNTNIINTYMTNKHQEKLLSEYEKTYKHFEDQNQPKIQDISLDIAYYPERKNLQVSGEYLLKNIGETTIDTLLVHYESDFQKTTFTFDKDLTLLHTDNILGLNIYKLNPSLSPDDSLRVAFTFAYQPTGFSNNGEIDRFQKNGTFMNTNEFPKIGYQSHYELTNERSRKKHGLPEKPVVSKVHRNYISSDADWVSYKATVSTSSDQTALMPGELIATWQENDRNYYTYEMTHNMLNFLTFLSAQYEVKQDSWQGINLEIYYHAGHPYNIDLMLEGMKEALAYYTEHFGAYPHSTLRIAEFPRYGSFAQAFAMLIPFSESVGFIADVKDDDVAYPFLVTAHEVAHQWWAHQVVGTQKDGSLMLSESFAEYSSMMVYRRKYSDHLYRKQLLYTLNGYLSGRSSGENPLASVGRQDYIYYNKGNLVLSTTARLIGEEALNKAMQEFLAHYKYSYPYPEAEDFMSILSGFVPDTLNAVINEMFNEIAIYDHMINKAVCKEGSDALFATTLTFTTEKRLYDKEGRPEVVEPNIWLEVGLLDDEELFSVQKVLVMQRENTVQIISKRKPNEVVIDPYHMTLDVTPFNNTSKL